MSPGLAALVLVAAGVVAAVVERPPSGLARVALGVLLVGLVAAVVAVTTQPRLLAGPVGRRLAGGRMWPWRASTTAFTAATLSFGLASGLLVVDVLVS